MDRAILIALVGTGALAQVVGCSEPTFDAVSFACSSDPQCGPGWRCLDGLCARATATGDGVEPGDTSGPGEIDAPPANVGSARAFCAALGRGVGCTGSESPCNDVLTIDAVESSACIGWRDALLGCLATKPLVCDGSSLAYAGNEASSGESYSVGGFTIQTHECATQGDAWQSCLACKDSVPVVRQSAIDDYVPWGGQDCNARRGAFIDCVLADGMRCVDQAIFDPEAGNGGGKKFSFDWVEVYAGATCAALGDRWLDCVNCGLGYGFDKPGKDVGQPCAESGECAAGLTCALGHCTAECVFNGPPVCTGRHWAGSRCENDDGREPSCSSIVDACVTDCDGNDDCQAIQQDGFCPGNGAILAYTDGVVEYGVCFFGACGEGWNGCTATDPFPGP